MVNTNTPFKQHADVNYLVVGLGLTGFSTARYLMSKDYCCRVQDSRDIPPYFHALRTEFPLVDIIRQPLNSELIDWADVLVVSPGLSIAQPEIIHAIDLGKSVIGDIELFAQVVNKPVVAITGSNGKSTVTTLLGEMIAADNKSVAVGGNLGIPALDLLPKMVVKRFESST